MEPHPDIYKSLNTDRFEIRLLSLSPGQLEDPIETVLSTISLDEAPEFEALSYVWGDPAMRLPVTVCNHDITVTENLEGALRRMRLSDGIRVLWVDAICINQQNVLERNSQISLMRRVHQNALRVLVWLGPEDEEVTLSISTWQELAKGGHFVHTQCFENDRDRTCGNDIPLLEPLFSRAWWSRTWTLQESVLAREVQMFCGQLELDWEALVQANNSIREHRKTCCLTGLCNRCRDGLNHFINIITGISVPRKSLKLASGMDLIEVLGRQRLRSATDPRDKIYGCLGVAYPPQAAEINPNYASSIEEVYCQMIVSDILWRGSLSALNYSVDNQPATDTALPSWVADWRNVPSDPFLPVERMGRYTLYNASEGLDGTTKFWNWKYLSSVGILVDTVNIVGDLLDATSDKSIFNSISQWRSILRFDEAPNQSYITGGSLQDAFWRTLMIDAVMNDEYNGKYARSVPEDRTAFDTWWALVGVNVQKAIEDLPSLLRDPSYRRVHFAAPSAIKNRRFFTTSKGFIGNGPPALKTGQEVFVIHSAKTPMVLQRQQSMILISPDPVAQPLFTFVGDCYIHGIMDGQIVSSPGASISKINLA